MFTSLGKFLDERRQYGGQKEMCYSLLFRTINYSKSSVGPLNHFCATAFHGSLMKPMDPSKEQYF